MTGTDLIVLAPWIVFAAGLAVICLVLLRSRHAPRPRRPSRPFPGTPADREPASCANPQETRCPENNTETRPR
jgi:hypothetical protein